MNVCLYVTELLLNGWTDFDDIFYVFKCLSDSLDYLDFKFTI